MPFSSHPNPCAEDCSTLVRTPMMSSRLKWVTMTLPPLPAQASPGSSAALSASAERRPSPAHQSAYPVHPSLSQSPDSDFDRAQPTLRSLEEELEREAQLTVANDYDDDFKSESSHAQDAEYRSADDEDDDETYVETDADMRGNMDCMDSSFVSVGTHNGEFAELVAEARQLAQQIEINQLTKPTAKAKAAARPVLSDRANLPASAAQPMSPSRGFPRHRTLSPTARIKTAKPADHRKSAAYKELIARTRTPQRQAGNVKEATPGAAGVQSPSAAVPKPVAPTPGTPAQVAEQEAELYLLKRRLRQLMETLGRQPAPQLFRQAAHHPGHAHRPASPPQGGSAAPSSAAKLVYYSDFKDAIRRAGHVSAQLLDDDSLRQLFRSAQAEEQGQLDKLEDGQPASDDWRPPNVSVDFLIEFLGMRRAEEAAGSSGGGSPAAAMSLAVSRTSPGGADETEPEDFGSLLLAARREISDLLPLLQPSPSEKGAAAAAKGTPPRQRSPAAAAGQTAGTDDADGGAESTLKTPAAAADVGGDTTEGKRRQRRKGERSTDAYARWAQEDGERRAAWISRNQQAEMQRMQGPALKRSAAATQIFLNRLQEQDDDRQRRLAAKQAAADRKQRGAAKPQIPEASKALVEQRRRTARAQRQQREAEKRQREDDEAALEDAKLQEASARKKQQDVTAKQLAESPVRPVMVRSTAGRAAGSGGGLQFRQPVPTPGWADHRDSSGHQGEQPVSQQRQKQRPMGGSGARRGVSQQGNWVSDGVAVANNDGAGAARVHGRTTGSGRRRDSKSPGRRAARKPAARRAVPAAPAEEDAFEQYLLAGDGGQAARQQPAHAAAAAAARRESTSPAARRPSAAKASRTPRGHELSQPRHDSQRSWQQRETERRQREQDELALVELQEASARKKQQDAHRPGGAQSGRRHGTPKAARPAKEVGGRRPAAEGGFLERNQRYAAERRRKDLYLSQLKVGY